MGVLAEKHLLDNAIVVLLSDHGEALGADDDSMLRATGTSREIWDSLWGHGTSVLSPNQYHVLLAMRAFGRASLPGPEQDYDWPVSLEDLRPTLEAYATGITPERRRRHLAPALPRGPRKRRALAARVRFTETDFNTPETLAGRYEESGIIDEAAVYYELDRQSGWVQFRAEPPARTAGAQAAGSPLVAHPPGSHPRAAGDRACATCSSIATTPARRRWKALRTPHRMPRPGGSGTPLQARFPGELPPGEPAAVNVNPVKGL